MNQQHLTPKSKIGGGCRPVPNPDRSSGRKGGQAEQDVVRALADGGRLRRSASQVLLDLPADRDGYEGTKMVPSEVAAKLLDLGAIRWRETGPDGWSIALLAGQNPHFPDGNATA